MSDLEIVELAKQVIASWGESIYRSEHPTSLYVRVDRETWARFAEAVES